jgi:hypothetical protein
LATLHRRHDAGEIAVIDIFASAQLIWHWDGQM